MDEERGLRAIAEVVDAVGDDENVHSIAFHYDNPAVIIVTVADAQKAADLIPAALTDREFSVEIREGPPVEAHILMDEDLQEEQILDGETIDIMGGDSVTTSRARGTGTIGLFADISVFATGQRAYEISQANGIVSNNHVLAKNDTAQNGDIVRHRGLDIGFYRSAIPMTDSAINCDVALGEFEQPHIGAPDPAPYRVHLYQVREIGEVTGVRRPAANESIMKYGFVTKRTEGTIVGRATVNVDGRKFLNTYKTSNGFTRSGDSGSMVLGSDRRVIGIHAWGDKPTLRNPNPASYFAGVTNDDTPLDWNRGLELRF